MSDKRYYYITDEDYATSEANGICVSTLNKRVRVYGWDIDRAITQPTRRRRDHSSYLAIARENNIPDKVFYGRIHECKMNPQKAATKPVMTRTQAALHATSLKPRKFTPEQIAIAKKNNITIDRLYQRINRSKWSVEKAIHTPIMTQEQRNKETAKRDNYFRQQLQGAWKEQQAKKQA